MERLKALFLPGKSKGKYKAVSRSSFDNDEDPHEALVEDQVVSLRRTVWHLAASLAIVTLALFLTLFYIVLNTAQNPGKLRCDEILQHIGSDPNGFVPPGKICSESISNSIDPD